MAGGSKGRKGGKGGGGGGGGGDSSSKLAMDDDSRVERSLNSVNKVSRNGDGLRAGIDKVANKSTKKQLVDRIDRMGTGPSASRLEKLSKPQLKEAFKKAARSKSSQLGTKQWNRFVGNPALARVSDRRMAAL